MTSVVITMGILKLIRIIKVVGKSSKGKKLESGKLETVLKAFDFPNS